MYRSKISFGGKATTERWIVADSILSVSGSGRETSAGSRSTMVRKTSFLSSEAQWGQRAARQQGAEKNAADGDEDEGIPSSSEGSSSSSSRKKTRKRKAASTNSIGRSSAGRSTTSRSSSSQLSRRKRTRRRHETSPSLNDPFSEASEGDDQKEEDDKNDEEDWGSYSRSTGNAGHCLV